MSNMKKRITIIYVVVIMVLATSILYVNRSNVSAASSPSNIEDMQYSELQETALYLAQSVIFKNESIISEHRLDELFTSSAYDKYIKLVKNNEIGGEMIGDCIADVTYPDESSTGDTVLMVNSKVWYNSKEYNQLNLLEFHVNKDGKIYDFNVWMY